MLRSRIKFKNSVLEFFAGDFLKRQGSGGTDLPLSQARDLGKAFAFSEPHFSPFIN